MINNQQWLRCQKTRVRGSVRASKKRLSLVPRVLLLITAGVIVSCSAATPTGANVYEQSAVAPVTTTLVDTTSTTTPIPDTTTTTTTTTTVPAAPVTTTASVSVMDVPALNDESLLLRSYSLGQRGSEVVALQSILGLTADGWYWTQTRAAHLVRLTLLQLSTSGVPEEIAATSNPVGNASTTPTAPSAQAMCKTQVVSFAENILSTWGIPSPQIVFDETIRSEYYRAGWGVVVAKSCSDKTSIAHELGHYVLDLANGYNWSAHADEAEAHFAAGGWIKGAESSPGVEYAAHCIGWVLYGEGTCTHCPNNDMREHARSVLTRAGETA